MNWDLITRCGLRYTLLYAAATAVGLYVALRSKMAMLLLVGGGLILILISVGGAGTVRMGASAANAQAGGLQSGVVDAHDPQVKAMDSDIKVLFYGLGLVVFAMLTLVLVV